MPDKRPLIIDAKFPLEAITALRERQDRRRAQAGHARSCAQTSGKHIDDIAEKYLIPGETQDVALMFMPSESVYAELHDGSTTSCRRRYRAGVIIVSPSLLMLAIQVVQQIQKDARMREAADQIRDEVGAHDRRRAAAAASACASCRQHFGQTNEDIEQILISAEKIEKPRRADPGRRIRRRRAAEPPQIIPAPMTRKLGAGE